MKQEFQARYIYRAENSPDIDLEYKSELEDIATLLNKPIITKDNVYYVFDGLVAYVWQDH